MEPLHILQHIHFQNIMVLKTEKKLQKICKVYSILVVHSN